MNVIRYSLLLLCIAIRLAASPLSVSARIEPDTALPGLPVDLYLTVVNSGDRAQIVPERMVLVVRLPSGESIIPGEPLAEPVQTLPVEYRDSRTLKPGETRNFEIPLASAVTDGLMSDARLWTPGTYELQAFLHDDLRAADVQELGVEGLLGAGRISSPLIASTKATLNVEKPAGVDAEVWTEIIQQTDGRGLLRNDQKASDAVARRIWNQAAESHYAPYLLTYLRFTPHDELEGIWKRIVEHQPNHPVAEAIRLGDAQRKARQSESAVLRHVDLDTVLKQADQARNDLTKLATSSSHDLVRIRAADALAKLKSRDELIQMYRELGKKQ